MANLAFDREIINERERPFSSDINQALAQMDRTLRDVLLSIYSPRVSATNDSANPTDGFLGEAFRVRPISPLGMTVRLPKGFGFIYDVSDLPSDIDGVSGLNDKSPWKPLYLADDITIALAAAPTAPNSRYDVIEVKNNRRRTDPASRDVLNTLTGKFSPQSVFKTLGFDMGGSVGQVVDPSPSTAAISVKRGAPGNPPTAPAVTPGYTQIAQILVGPGVTTIDDNVIQDLRKMVYPTGYANIAMQWTTSGGSFVTLNQLNAPPGVKVGVVNIGVGQVKIYVFDGGNSKASADLAISAVDFFNASGPLSVLAISSTVIDAAMQSSLVGAGSAYALKVAIGQPAWVVTTTFPPPTNGIFTALISLRGV